MTINLTQEEFKEKVLDYTVEDPRFKGDRPAIVDFFADWCQPCKMVAPILEKISEEFADKIDIYKVNVDENQELSVAFGIQSIPSILFIPIGELPQMAMGALPEESIKKAIKEVLKVE